ncbi:hypothetical protein Tco_0087057 [Tanacetum coccineum]
MNIESKARMHIGDSTYASRRGSNDIRIIDPYVAVRQAQLVDTETESELKEAPSEAEKSQPLGSRVPFTGEEFEASEQSVRAQPAMSPGLSASVTETMTLSDLAFHTKTEDDKSEADGVGSGSEESGDKSFDLEEEEEEATPEGQQQTVPVEDTAVDEPFGLGYEALRRHELALGEGSVPSTFEIGQSSRSVLKHEEAERVSAFRQPTLVTWVDPEDVSPSFPVVPSPIASPATTSRSTISVDEDQFLEVGTQLELYGSILHDHTQRLEALPPTLFEGYDRDLREFYTRSGATDAQRAALWHAIYDIPRENHDLRRQITEERRE